ncbi:hypothetical protein SAMN02746062_00877 [Alysiella filiformis DSM 16848]|uniref:Lipoprotein n=2 Tax=Alysiella TaxID=194195 RepID=A0A286E8R9_9NEIS|nr:hypothetical protein H3L97_04430 [Alysiella filiformis]SOD67302.1 hypothetical protein SAMN02746062_00877 [Alysiella filiformis DSM 16848]
MKKIALTLTTLLALSACGGTGSTDSLGNIGSSAGAIGKNLFNMYVQNQCVSELQSRNEWRLIALAMSQEKQTEWENKICGCVSEEAPMQLTAADMTQLIHPDGRTKVIAEVGAKTVTACYKKIFKQ